MTRRAQPGDEPALDGFLAAHSASSMFLRGNLAAFGLTGSDHPHATVFHIYPKAGPILAVSGRTNSGMVLCQAPDADEAIQAYAGCLDDGPMMGFSGDADQTGALIGALGLHPETDFRMNHVEPLFRLDLADLPQGAGKLRPAMPDDTALLTGWFLTYAAETGLAEADPVAAMDEARDRAEAAIGASSVRLLDGKDGPVAMAGLNARAGTSVQVGGVFVPAALRGRGLGREVTRALLAEARAGGATEAVLFANNDPAARAYRALGFAQIGWYRIAFLNQPRG